MPYENFRTKILAWLFTQKPDHKRPLGTGGLSAVVCIGYGSGDQGSRLNPISLAISNEARNIFSRGEADMIILTGRGSWHPATPMAEAMRMHINGSVPKDRIFTEPYSFSTRNHAINILPILNEKKVGRIFLLTKALHARRAKALFKKAFEGSGIDVITIPIHGKYYEEGDRFRDHLGYLIYDSTAFVVSWVFGWVDRNPLKLFGRQ